MDNGYSLADIAAATGEGFGGSNGWIMIILFALIFGNGGFFGGRGDYGQFATAASQQEILFGQQFQNIDNKIDRIGNGIADATFALNNSIKDGNAMVAGRVVDEGRAIQSQIADTNANIAAQTQKVLDAISTNRIADMQNQINQLQLQAAMCGVVRYPNGMTYDAGTSPFCGCNNSCCR